jgi:4a-hydroxytetrahydrobiopterin dehydratase
MSAQTYEQLTAKKCQACEGRVEKYTLEQAQSQLSSLIGWHINPDGLRIRKDWKAKNFSSAMEFLTKVAQLAEEEGHHPDVHLQDYRKVCIELWTHAVGGLTENDFILAAKIDRLDAP